MHRAAQGTGGSTLWVSRRSSSCRCRSVQLAAWHHTRQTGAWQGSEGGGSYGWRTSHLRQQRTLQGGRFHGA